MLFLTACYAHAQDKQVIERRLQEDHVGKYWVIRGFHEGNELVFDAGGQLLKGEPPQSWTLAGVEITSLQLRDSDLAIRGNRVAYAYSEPDKKFNHLYRVIRRKNNSENETLRITLKIPDPSDEPSLRHALAQVLIADGDDLSQEVPEYWRCFLEHCGNPLLRSKAEALGTVRKVGQEVTPPKPLKTPDPKYAEPARAAKFQGHAVLWLVIDQSGNTRDVTVALPVGFGLDDKAVEAVQGWKFKPAEFNGEPVAVQLKVDVTFRLY